MTTSRSFRVMSKPSGSVCNLDCDYCYFLSKEELYPGSQFRMPDGVHHAYVEQLLAASGADTEVTFVFQGGEPLLMGLDFFRRTLELQERLRLPGQTILNTVQTNGTLVDASWAEFFHENGFLVGVSIDGPRELHDQYRRDKGGKPTFDRVVRGLEHLTRHGVDWNALTTVNAANGDHGSAVYRFLREDVGASYIQFIPVVERVPVESLQIAELGWGQRNADRILYQQHGSSVTSRSVGAEQFGQFMVDVFEEWARYDVGDVFVTNFDTALAHWLGMHQVGSCVHAETCGGELALEHTGDVYSCDHYVEPDHLLGTIAEGRTLLELAISPKQRDFGQAKRDTLPGYCRRCDVRFACHGGCPKDRFISTPDGQPGLHYLCAGYQRFFRHVDASMRVLAGVVRSGGDPAALRTWYADRDAEQSQAAQCTCGRAISFAQCHGRRGL